MKNLKVGEWLLSVVGALFWLACVAVVIVFLVIPRLVVEYCAKSMRPIARTKPATAAPTVPTPARSDGVGRY